MPQWLKKENSSEKRGSKKIKKMIIREKIERQQKKKRNTEKIHSCPLSRNAQRLLWHGWKLPLLTNTP